MATNVIRILDGPDKPALQWALLYPERGQTVTFKIEGETVEASIAKMEEVGSLDFDLTGTFVSGGLRNRAFPGNYSVETRSGALTLTE